MNSGDREFRGQYLISGEFRNSGTGNSGDSIPLSENCEQYAYSPAESFAELPTRRRAAGRSKHALTQHLRKGRRAAKARVGHHRKLYRFKAPDDSKPCTGFVRNAYRLTEEYGHGSIQAHLALNARRCQTGPC